MKKFDKKKSAAGLDLHRETSSMLLQNVLPTFAIEKVLNPSMPTGAHRPQPTWPLQSLDPQGIPRFGYPTPHHPHHHGWDTLKFTVCEKAFKENKIIETALIQAGLSIDRGMPQSPSTNDHVLWKTASLEGSSLMEHPYLSPSILAKGLSSISSSNFTNQGFTTIIHQPLVIP